MAPAASGPTGPVGGARWPAETLSAVLKAMGDTTRLRVLAVLRAGDLAVGEVAEALGQSQPRVSRHIKLLAEARLVERTSEGALVLCRLPGSDDPAYPLLEAALTMIDPADPVFQRDLNRRKAISAERDAAAAAYFARSAEDWDRVRALHLPDADIEAAMRAAAGPGPFDLMVDVGVGTGQTIVAFADRIRRAEGFDLSRQMLSVARARLEASPALAEVAVRVRLGDIYDPPLAPGCADLVTVQQVLHFLSEPGRAVAAAAGLLAPGGVVVIVDFAPHHLEFLRSAHAHRRLGFSVAEVSGWLAAAGLEAVRTDVLGPSPVAAGGQGLQVLVWSARRPAAPVQRGS